MQVKQDKNMEVFQDVADFNREFEMNQQELGDIIKQNTDMYTEGLEDEYDALDELEIQETLNKYDKNVPQTQKVTDKDANVQKDKVAPQKQTKKFDDMFNELLN